MQSAGVLRIYDIDLNQMYAEIQIQSPQPPLQMKFVNLFWIGDSSPAVVTQITNTETQKSEFKVTLYTRSKTLDFGGYETMPIFV